MGLFTLTDGPKVMQPVLYAPATGSSYAAIITGVNVTGSATGAVSLAYFVPGSTTLGAATNVPNDQTGVTIYPSYRWPQEYL